MTIEELAARAACTTRNIRNYQTLGILPHPTVMGRVGYYGPGHLARLRLVAQLQEHGFSLAGISQLLQAWEEGRTLADVLGFEEALTTPWIEEEPVLMRAEELLALFPESIQDPSLAARSLQIGLIAFEGDLVRVDSPRLLRIGVDLTRAGVPLAAVLDELVVLRSDLERVAKRFVAMFDRHVWAPFVAAGMPRAQLPSVTEALRRMRPLAASSVEVVLAQAMNRATAENTAVRAALAAVRGGASAEELGADQGKSKATQPGGAPTELGPAGPKARQ